MGSIRNCSFVINKFRNRRHCKVKGMWYTYNAKSERILDPGGYECNRWRQVIPAAHCSTRHRCYRFRLFHIKDIIPSGWIALPCKRAPSTRSLPRRTHEYTINYNHIVLSTTRRIEFHKICAFDIEASSSHGDFPLARKTYRKLAENIADTLEDRGEMPIDAFVDTAIRTAFRIPGNSLDGIQCVYPQGRVTDRDLSSLIPEWMESEPCKHAPPPDEVSDAESSDDETEVDEGVAQEDGAEGGG